jgi:hypothetical protein
VASLSDQRTEPRPRRQALSLTRSHLRELGLGRAAIDAVFRELEDVVFPGSSRPHVRRESYLA